MTGNQYQTLAEKTNTVTGEFALYYATLGLVGEAGEIANKVKKIIRDDNGKITQEKKDDLSKELGDVMWYIARTCNELELSLDNVMQQNIEKLLTRLEKNTIQGEGDNR